MREIKFRVFSEKEGMVYIKPNHWQWLGENVVNNPKEKRWNVMQFTGIKDKNGKEIYEGDIFQDEEDGAYNFVEWNDYFGGWGTNEWFLPKDLVEQAPYLEVIGNIYENPELLNNK